MNAEIKIIRQVSKETAKSYKEDKAWFSKRLSKNILKMMVETFLNNYNDSHGTSYSLNNEKLHWENDVYHPFKELGIEIIDSLN